MFNEKTEEIRREMLLTEFRQRIRDVKQGPDGFVYLLTDENPGRAVEARAGAIKHGPALRAVYRSSFRTTSFNPDHVSSTAHTLMSTNPIGSATSRITSSVMSVGTFDVFFGHDTQMAASGLSALRSVAQASSPDRAACS